MKKQRPILLVALIMCGLFLLSNPQLSKAQTRPTVPEFTVKIEAHPYYVLPTFKIDPYTGENITTNVGYHAKNQSVVITIKNQPFDYHSNHYLYYNVRYKGHFGENWEVMYYYTNFSYSSEQRPRTFPATRNSEVTVLTVPLEKMTYNNFSPIPANAQVDFQVMAISMYEAQIKAYRHLFDLIGYSSLGLAVGESSSWSETQTIAIPDDSPSSHEEPTPTQSLTPTLSHTQDKIPTPTEEPTTTPSPSPTPTQPNNQAVPQTEFYTTIAIFTVAITALTITVTILTHKIKKLTAGNKP